MLKTNALKERRKQRTRSRIRKAGAGRPRLSIFRSNKNIYAQVVDDLQGNTVVSASSMEKAIAGRPEVGFNQGCGSCCWQACR